MAAAFLTRPWLLAPSRPATLPLLLSARRAYRPNLEQTRGLKTNSAYKQGAMMVRKQQSQQPAASTVLKEMRSPGKVNDPAALAMLAPKTIVPLPLSKQPRAPKEFIRYNWEVLRQRFMDLLENHLYSWATKPKWTKPALIRSSNSEIIAAARKLHASMSHCLAKGGATEKAQLGQICVPTLHRSLLSAIERRPAGKSYEWERIAETGSPWWPRVVDKKWKEVDVGFKMTSRQAVVGIKSKQRLSELNARGERVSTKEMELLEYIVLWRQVDAVNLTQTDWKIFGTLKETTYEALMEEKDEVNEAQRFAAEQNFQLRSKKVQGLPGHRT